MLGAFRRSARPETRTLGLDLVPLACVGSFVGRPGQLGQGWWYEVGAMTKTKLKATHSRKLKFRDVHRESAAAGAGIDPRVRALLPPDAVAAKARLHANERGDPYFFVPGEEQPTGYVGVVREGRWQAIDVPCRLDGHACLSPHGSVLAIVHEASKRLVVDTHDFTSGETRRVLDLDTPSRFRFQRRPGGIAFTPEGIVVLASNVLILVGPDPTEPAAHVELDEAYRLTSGLQGRLLITQVKSRSALLTVRNGAFELLRNGKFGLPRYVYENAEGEVYLDVIDSVQQIVGVAEAVGWSPNDLPPAPVAALEGTPAFARRSARTIPGSPFTAAPAAAVERALAGGHALAIRASQQEGLQLHLDGVALDAPGPASAFAGPLYAVSPDEQHVAWGTSDHRVYVLAVETGQVRQVGQPDGTIRRLAHTGDAVVVHRRSTTEIQLSDLQVRDCGITGRVDALVALKDVLIVCSQGGGSGPPQSDVLRRTGDTWTKAAELPLGVECGWSYDGRHFVSCFHGRGTFELAL